MVHTDWIFSRNNLLTSVEHVGCHGRVGGTVHLVLQGPGHGVDNVPVSQVVHRVGVNLLLQQGDDQLEGGTVRGQGGHGGCAGLL